MESEAETCPSEQVSVLRDIGRTGGINLRADQFNAVLDLIALDYVEADESTETGFKLTAEGRTFLEDSDQG
jgi:hypothetical protein